MIRPIHLIWAVLVMGIGTALFLVAYEVDDREKELLALRREIRETAEAIHVLNAEWSYLNAPARLDRLASEHLGLASIKPEQYTTIAMLPDRPAPETTPDAPPAGTTVPPYAAGDVPLAKNEQDSPAARAGAGAVASAPTAPIPPPRAKAPAAPLPVAKVATKPAAAKPTPVPLPPAIPAAAPGAFQPNRPLTDPSFDTLGGLR
jgi:hypothetical protein